MRVGFVVLAGWLVAAPAGAQQTPYQGHGADSIPPEVVRKYLAPPLDADVSRRIQAMLDVRATAVGTLTPDGRTLFFNWSITGTPQVWRVDRPQGFPIQVTGGEDPTRLVGIMPDGRHVILSRDRGGQEDPGLYLQPLSGGTLVEIHHVEKTRASFAFATADSKAVYFTANDIKPDSYALYRFDVQGGRRSLVFDEPGLWLVADHREDGPGEVKILLAKATGAASREYFEWSTRTRTLTPLLGQGERESYNAEYAAAPGEFLVLTNKLGEFRRLYRWKPGGDLVPVSPDQPMDVAGFGQDRARRRLYYLVNDGGYNRLRVLDASALTPVDLPLPKDADQVSLGGATPDGRFVTLGIETASAPRVSYAYDWQTGQLTAWTTPGAPEMDLTRFAPVHLDSYPARDGTRIPIFVRYPAACAPDAPPPPEPCPVIVDFHGGPEGQARPGFDPRAQLFVDAGFIFVEPNVRGSDGYGRTWLDADNGPKRLDVITDIEDAGRALKARWTRNGRAPKVGIYGGSYGGYSVLVGMTMFAGTYDAGVSLVGISNLVTFLENTAPYRRALRASEYGDPEKDRAALLKLSPTSYVDRVKGPLLIIQGVDDPRVPAGESLQMHEALAARGVPSQLILLAGEGHGAARRGGQVIMLGHSLRFFEQHLLGRTGNASH